MAYLIVLNFRNFAQIHENKFPRNFSKHADSEWDYNEHDGNIFDMF